MGWATKYWTIHFFGNPMNQLRIKWWSLGVFASWLDLPPWKTSRLEYLWSLGNPHLISQHSIFGRKKNKFWDVSGHPFFLLETTKKWCRWWRCQTRFAGCPCWVDGNHHLFTRKKYWDIPGKPRKIFPFELRLIDVISQKISPYCWLIIMLEFPLKFQ